MRDYGYRWLSRTHMIRLGWGWRFGMMCIGPYLLTQPDAGEAFIGLAFGPLYVEVTWYVAEETRLAKWLFDL